MKLSVDRIIGQIAICVADDNSVTQVPLTRLPQGTKEASVLEFDGDEYVLDLKEEEIRKKRILEKQNSLFQD